MASWRFLPLGLLLLPQAAHAQAAGDRFFPPGALVGNTLTLTFPGFDKVESATLVVEGEGVKPVGPFLKGVGQVAVAADAVPGIRQMRLVGPKSATEWRPFSVGTLPEVLEKEPNNSRDKAQLLERLPVTLNGAIPTATDVDTYRVSLKKGECLVVASESRILAGPVYLALIVRDAQGRRLAVSVDQRRPDPVFACVAPADGEYVLQFSDVTSNLGSTDEGCQYRLHITTGPWLGYAVPPSVARGGTASLTVHGWNLGGKPGAGEALAKVASSAEGVEIRVSAASAPNSLTLPLTNQPALPEAEPNDASESAQSLTLPAAVHGDFSRRGDRDFYRFTAKAQEVLRLDVDARDWDSLADVRMVVRDSAGKVLLSVDDSNRSKDPREVWTVPADGSYTLSLEDLGGTLRSGPATFYRLSVGSAVPEMSLIAAGSRLEVKPGAKAEWSFTLQQSQQPEEVTVRVEGLPAGVTAEVVKVPGVPRRSGQAAVKLTLIAAADAKPSFAMVRVIASTAGGLTALASWRYTGDGGVSLGVPPAQLLLVQVPAP